MGENRSGLNVPLVALQATEHLEGRSTHVVFPIDPTGAVTYSKVEES